MTVCGLFPIRLMYIYMYIHKKNCIEILGGNRITRPRCIIGWKVSISLRFHLTVCDSSWLFFFSFSSVTNFVYTGSDGGRGNDGVYTFLSHVAVKRSAGFFFFLFSKIQCFPKRINLRKFGVLFFVSVDFFCKQFLLP